ncbi:MAG: hypothetical protein AAGE65_02950 [Planctomycetota bacterium]
MKLWPHHERAIASLIGELSEGTDALALILGGSLARGWGSPTSDLDGHLLIAESAMERHVANGQYVFVPQRNHCDYDGGYVDLKLVSHALLEDAAARASEPFRNAYVGVEVVWARDGVDADGLRSLMARIATYPEADHAEKVMLLASHLRGMHWYVAEADKRDDRYLMLWCAQRTALLAARLVLAENRMLYPFHKWLMRSVRELPQKPAGLLDAIDAALATPSAATVRALAELVDGWRDWGAPDAWWNPWLSRTEWAWRIRGEGAMGIDEV